MSDALLELRGLTVDFATDDGVVHAVDGIDLAHGPRARRSAWWASRAAARA
jgi:ABC-type antimicrobial peptide transport system ATPase subunit